MLQWGRTLSSAERELDQLSAKPPPVSFNGAALFQVRKGPASSLAILRLPPLQWGRTLSSAESQQTGRQERRNHQSLQWGRTLSSAERFNCFGDRRAGEVSFNGAALFQVRKDHSLTIAVPSTRLASMGPHSFKCGKTTAEPTAANRMRRFNGAALFQVRKEQIRIANSKMHAFMLQWGRTLSSAERLDFLRCGGYILSFNGAALFQVRKAGIDARQQINKDMLQWGRTLSSAERLHALDLAAVLVDTLQWGRTLSSAERTNLRTRRDRRVRASMGPHSFKCGKFRAVKCGPTEKKGFNGAALFQVRKDHIQLADCQMIRFRLQWGRTLSSAERQGVMVD